MDDLFNIETLMKSPPPVLLSAVLWMVLQAAKQIPGFPYRWLPVISLALGAIGYPLLVGLTGKAIMFGLLIGGLPTALDQAFTQPKKPADVKPPGDQALLLLFGFFFVGACLYLVTGCSAPKPTPKPVVVIPPAHSTATVEHASGAVGLSGQVWTRDSVRLNPDSRKVLDRVATDLEDMVNNRNASRSTVELVVGQGGAPLSDALTLYLFWSRDKPQDQQIIVLAALANGIRSGLSVK